MDGGYSLIDGGSVSRAGADVKSILRRQGLFKIVGGFVVVLLVIFLVFHHSRSSTGKAKNMSFNNSPNRMIPFLANMMKVPELGKDGNVLSMPDEEVLEVSHISYAEAKQKCRVPTFAQTKASLDRVLFEISVGNCGSTWQLLVISYLVHSHGFYMPLHHIMREEGENWPGLDNYTPKKVSRHYFGHGPGFGKLYKIQHKIDEIEEVGALKFTAFKRKPQWEADINEFAIGACPCCVLHKDVLGDREKEVATIYMHAFALGLDLNEEDLYETRKILARWIQKKYCFPGSVHTSACSVVDE